MHANTSGSGTTRALSRSSRGCCARAGSSSTCPPSPPSGGHHDQVGHIDKRARRASLEDRVGRLPGREDHLLKLVPLRTRRRRVAAGGPPAQDGRGRGEGRLLRGRGRAQHGRAVAHAPRNGTGRAPGHARRPLPLRRREEAVGWRLIDGSPSRAPKRRPPAQQPQEAGAGGYLCGASRLTPTSLASPAP